MDKVYTIVKIVILLAIGWILSSIYSKNRDRIHRSIKVAKVEWSKK